MTAPGPAPLGRGVIVGPGQAAPPAWAGAPRVAVGALDAEPAAAAAAALHTAWLERRPVVVELAVDQNELRAPRRHPGEPWQFGARFDPVLDRLHFLVWANNYDARNPGAPPVWWWARRAARTCGAAEGGGADVVLPDGREAWLDGGPRPAPAVGGTAVVVHRESIELGSLAPAPPPPRPPDAALAADQRAAVEHGSGPARVIAPAGSGKTRVLTERLRRLHTELGYERAVVLAVAYNKKAQEELEARTADFAPRVRTLNSLAYELVARAGGGRAPTVLDEREVRRLVEQVFPIPRNRRSNLDPLGPYLEALSIVRLALRDPAEVEAERDDVPGLAEGFAAFRAGLRNAAAVDFDEQIYAAIEALLGDGAFRREAQGGCRHLLVDEFQDLTPAHVLLLRLLAAPGFDVFGVGDDDQVIYGHAGADPGFLVGFGELFPGAASHPLEVNYRCPAAVVDAAANLLTRNRRRVPKQIRPGPAAPSGADRLTVLEHPPEGGARALAELVLDWLGEPGAAPGEVAVLTRVNSLLLAPHVVLAEAGVPIASVLRPDTLARTGLRAALAYLRIGAEPDRIAPGDIVEILRRPTRGLPQWFPDRLRTRKSWRLDSLGDLRGRLDDKVADKLDRLIADLALVAAAAASGDTRTTLLVIRDQVGLGQAMDLLDGSKGGTGASHLDDLEALLQVADLAPDPAAFEALLRASLERTPDPGGVTLSTVHRVKGMEWPRVAVYGVTAGLLPHRLAEDHEEERRVLHVAITRGAERVAVLADRTRPSPFLAELAAPGAPPAHPQEGAAAARAGRRTGAARSGAAPSGSPGPALDAPAEARAEALRGWRLERARASGAPAYVVLHNRTIDAIARAAPADLAALARIEGIGPAKLELYGEEILEVLAAAQPL